MRRAAIVFAGGGLGACLRALLLAWLRPWAATLPLPVLLANGLGAFALGVVFILADEAGLLRAEARLFLAVGVLGGFTTFSTFGWGADLLLAGGHGLAALAYLAASLVGGVAAAWAGLGAGRALTAPLGRGGARRPRPDAAADIAAIEAEDRDTSA